MIHKVTAMTMRQNMGEILNGVQYRHDTVLIIKAGKPVAAMIDIKLYEKIARMNARFDELTEKFAESFADLDQEAAEQLIDEAVSYARKEKIKKTED